MHDIVNISLCVEDSGQDHSQTLFYYFLHIQTTVTLRACAEG